nr:unnamed protein product [Callosobruchus analis]
MPKVVNPKQLSDLRPIMYPNGLRFINVYIYCKPPYQPKYQYLRKVLEPLKEIGYFQYTDDKNIVAMDELINSGLKKLATTHTANVNKIQRQATTSKLRVREKSMTIVMENRYASFSVTKVQCLSRSLIYLLKQSQKKSRQ